MKKLSLLVRSAAVSTVALPLSAVFAAGITVGNVELATAPGDLVVDGGAAYPMSAVTIDPATGNVTITTADQSFTDGDGSTDDGSTGDGSTGDGSTGDGSTGDGSTGDGSTGDGSTGDGSTDDGATGGSCEQWVPSRELVLAEGDGTVNLDDEIKSFPFAARQDVRSNQASYTTTNPVTKTVWVSLCPGGAPLNRLIAEGYQSAAVRYSGGPDENPPYLIEGKTYYFNVMNAQSDTPEQTTCKASNCPAVIRFY